MAGKQHLAVSSFHNGLNTKTGSRDIGQDELAKADNISVDDVGQITISGGSDDISTSSAPSASTITDGYSLFRFSSDYAADGTTQTETDYIILWVDNLGKFYWLPGNTTWATVATVLDLSSDWGTGETAKPVFYYVDGALRISDGNFANTNNPPQWIGAINRSLFPDASNPVAITGWKREKQELLKPAVGTLSQVTSTNAPSTGIHWTVRNLVPDDQLYNFSTAEQADGAGTDDVGQSLSYNALYTTTKAIKYDEGNSTGSISPEHWQTSRKEIDGYGDSNYHAFGMAFHGENDDHSNTFKWTGIGSSTVFNTGGSAKTFSSGQSIYLAIRHPGDEAKQYWQGTHTRAFSDSASLALSIQDSYIKFTDNATSNYMKFRIDHTKFTSESTPSGVWHIVEFSYDEAYETSISGSFYPRIIELEMNISWVRTGSVYSNGTSSGTPSPFSKYRDIPGFDLIQLSDMRIGDTDLIGVTTVGKQKFLMSYTYDETEAESLLYDFGGGSSQEIVLNDSTSSYQIGIQARVNTSVGNNRVTGANLYMEDDGIPYRIAQLKYLKGLKGAWESEYPSSGRFSNDTDKVSSTIKTNGLPLLESYEANNGFKPSVDSIIANYKTATVLNRRTYVANVYQNSKKYGDRMIKSKVGAFDVIPSEGRGIDVVKNDGDIIVKLESYADRILQFKKNTMYLINATRDAEFLEDTFIGKGISHPSSSCSTDIGIAWVNENGCYLYNGQSVVNLIDGKILDTEWQTFASSTSDIIYLPLKDKLIVSGGTNGVDTFEYSTYTKSWNKGISRLSDNKTNFILDIDGDIKYFTNTSNSYRLRKWDDTSINSGDVNFITKDFTFGNPASRKKCFKFYITYKSTGTTNVQVHFGTNGEDLTDSSKGTQVSDSSKYAGTNTACYSSSNGLGTTLVTGGEPGIWKQAELVPTSSINNVYSVQLRFKSNGTVPADFCVNDITIVYREKPMK